MIIQARQREAESAERKNTGALFIVSSVIHVRYVSPAESRTRANLPTSGFHGAAVREKKGV